MISIPTCTASSFAGRVFHARSGSDFLSPLKTFSSVTTGLTFRNVDEISLPKAMSGFLNDAGLPGLTYDEESIFPAGELLNTTQSLVHPLNNGVYVTARASGNPLIDYEGRPIDNLLYITLELNLTAQEQGG